MKEGRHIVTIHWIPQQSLVLQLQCLVVAVLLCGESPAKVVGEIQRRKGSGGNVQVPPLRGEELNEVMLCITGLFSEAY